MHLLHVAPENDDYFPFSSKLRALSCYNRKLHQEQHMNVVTYISQNVGLFKIYVGIQ